MKKRANGVHIEIEDTAQRIPGARPTDIEGKGHDRPDGVVRRLLAPMIPHLDATQATP